MKCEICFSKKLIFLKNSFFCESCEIYYKIENNEQKILKIPNYEINQINFDFCSSCCKLKNINNKIICRNFNDYYKRLTFCKSCKNKNKNFLKSLFNKNFILYKKKQRQFNLSLFFIIILNIILQTQKYFFSDINIKNFLLEKIFNINKILISYNFIRKTFLIIIDFILKCKIFYFILYYLILIYKIFYKIVNLNFLLKIIFIYYKFYFNDVNLYNSILFLSIFINNYYLNIFINFYLIYFLFIKKYVFYKVPINLLLDNKLEGFIGKLKINKKKE